eukprot:CAMPEP_0197597304 /NCGR_PEP_ID=MMETSP1326-20131121/27015_1 /TAXON_ID=1155430 /ORGANISM="Genus nov. species nov., Strain RCC2288" /LENGTH=79 /DNA_ID=CAMNT_0043163957 /DNA_START=31 /DNA_END=266 /DNA_ORIENTATION=+
MMAAGASPLMGNFPGGSPMNLYHSLLSSPGSNKLRDAAASFGGTPSILRKNTVLRTAVGAGAGVGGGAAGAMGAMAPPT